MLDAGALLISTDELLVATLRDAIASVPSLHITTAVSCAEGQERLTDESTAIVVAHLRFPHEAADIAQLLRHLAATRRSVATLVISDHSYPEEVLLLLRQGAVDVLTRPLDLGRLTFLVDMLTVRNRCAPRKGAAAPVPSIHRFGRNGSFLDCGGRLQRMMEQVRLVAATDAIVLLSGETGTGKTALSRLIHELSPRANEPFLVVHCAALSAGLIESEMFGHVRGAFTGADRDRIGKFRDAGRGSLLLDDIDTLPLSLQAKLLHVIEQKIFEPVGCNVSEPVRARLMAATNQSLPQAVAAGHFRADLYYRLDVVEFHLPPLRERREVIAAIAERFIAEFSARNGRPAPTLTPEAVIVLKAYDWPGNIRQLRNVIERAIALCTDSTLSVELLSDELRHQSTPTSEALNPVCATLPPTPPAPFPLEPAATLRQAKEDVERHRLTWALEKHGNNRLRAALELGISRVTLYKKLHRYGLI